MKTEQTNKIPVYRRLADEIKAEILSGKRAPGSVLPSERLMAQQLGVHRNTVAKAYNELEAEELIDARQGVGYLVHAADAARLHTVTYQLARWRRFVQSTTDEISPSRCRR